MTLSTPPPPSGWYRITYNFGGMKRIKVDKYLNEDTVRKTFELKFGVGCIVKIEYLEDMTNEERSIIA